MSSFKRTSTGLNNQHLFYDVDLIVFVEGGTKSFTKEEVHAGHYHSETEDVIFWRNIFSLFENGKKIKFKSVGSKTTIKEIVVDIVDGKLQTVLVAMDSEFDELFKQKIVHPNVFYTCGYSWENDVWSDEVIKNIIEELTAIRIEHNELKENFQSFLKSLKVAVYADGYLFKRASSFFPRKTGWLFCIDCSLADLPKIKHFEIQKKIVEKGLKIKTLYSFGSRYSINTYKHCFGHLLADYCCQLIFKYLKKNHGLTGVTKDTLYRMGINKAFQNFEKTPAYLYYKESFDERQINA